MATPLLDVNRRKGIVQEGESCRIRLTLTDVDSVAIPKASLITLTFSLFDQSGETIINERDEVSVLDANGGTVSAGGVLTLWLDPADNPIVGTPATDKTEKHTLQFTWTWNDGITTRTGKNEPYTLLVQQLAEPVEPDED